MQNQQIGLRRLLKAGQEPGRYISFQLCRGNKFIKLPCYSSPSNTEYDSVKCTLKRQQTQRSENILEHS